MAEQKLGQQHRLRNKFSTFINMEEELNTREAQENKKEKKAKEKAEKEQSTAERTLQSYERTLLAWVRTGAHLMTFGFAIYKLLQQKVVESVERLGSS